MSNYETETRVSQLIQGRRYQQAYKLLLPLASKESEYAHFVLGWMHENGAHVEKNANLARSYYEHAIKLGSVDAYLWLGRLLEDAGQKAEARRIFEKGAELGDLGCMNELGTILYECNGDPAEVAKGITWLKRAAAQGHFFAKRKLLSIEANNARSIFEKAFVLVNIVTLGVKGALESIKDKWSERLR